VADALQSRLEKAIPPGDRLLLDSSVVISYLGGGDRWADVARVVVEGLVRPGRNPAIVSALSVMEALVGPMRHVPPGHRTALDFFAHWPNLTVLPVDLAVAQEAASVRAHHSFAAPDALVIGTGIAGGVSWLVSSDERWRRTLAQISSRVRVCYLGDFV
jgi:predicted nucleic acid-binding protein